MTNPPPLPPPIPAAVPRPIPNAEVKPKRKTNPYLVALAAVGFLLFMGCSGLGVWFSLKIQGQYRHASGDVDEEIRKIHAVGLPVTVEELKAWKAAPPDDENAAVALMSAFDAMVYEEDKNGPLYDLTTVELPKAGEHLSPELKSAAQDLVEKNSECFALIHEAVQKPKSRFRTEIDSDTDFNIEHVTLMRECGKLLALKCRLALEAGDCDGAFHALDDAIRLPHALVDDPVTMSQFTRLALHGLFLQSMAAALSQGCLTEPQLAVLREAVVREIDPEALFKAMVGERCVGFAHTSTFGSTPSKNGGPTLPLQQHSAMERSIQYSYLIHMGRLVDACRLPSFERVRAMNKVRDELNFEGRTLTMMFHMPDMIASTFVASGGALYNLQDRYTATISLEQTVIAIERYRLKTGGIPPTLDALAPEFIDQVPVDPFTQKPFIYKVAGQGYTLGSAAAYPPDVETDKRKPSVVNKSRDELTVVVTHTPAEG